MSIGSIDSSTSALSFTQSSQSTHHHHQLDLSKTAQLLGVSTNQLSSDLQSGQKLSSLASAAGVSSSNLLSSVEADLKSSAPQGAPSLSGTQLQQMATNIVNGQGPAGAAGPGGSGAEAAGSAPSMSNTAQLLGVSTNQLSSDLQSGQTLSSLASTAGVSSSNLLSSVEADLKSNAPQGAPSLSGTQLAGIATNIINGTGPTGGSGFTTSSSSTDTATTNLNSLASTLGMNPSDLLAQINSGDDLSQLLGSTSQTGYGSTTAKSANGGVIFDQYA
jgi:hypothetical protein